MGNRKTADRLTCGYWRYGHLSNLKHWITRSLPNSSFGNGSWSWILSTGIKSRIIFILTSLSPILVTTWNRSRVFFFRRINWFLRIRTSTLKDGRLVHLFPRSSYNIVYSGRLIFNFSNQEKYQQKQMCFVVLTCLCPFRFLDQVYSK